jgi:hypothetical protein
MLPKVIPLCQAYDVEWWKNDTYFQCIMKTKETNSIYEVYKNEVQTLRKGVLPIKDPSRSNPILELIGLLWIPSSPCYHYVPSSH